MKRSERIYSHRQSSLIFLASFAPLIGRYARIAPSSRVKILPKILINLTIEKSLNNFSGRNNPATSGLIKLHVLDVTYQISDRHRRFGPTLFEQRIKFIILHVRIECLGQFTVTGEIKPEIASFHQQAHRQNSAVVFRPYFDKFFHYLQARVTRVQFIHHCDHKHGFGIRCGHFKCLGQLTVDFISLLIAAEQDQSTLFEIQCFRKWVLPDNIFYGIQRPFITVAIKTQQCYKEFCCPIAARSDSCGNVRYRSEQLLIIY